MAEMTVRGNAKRTVKCDSVKYLFKFCADGNTASQATENVSHELEAFLKLMKEHDISPDLFRLAGNDTVKNYRNSENDPLYSAFRSVELTLTLDSANCDGFVALISANDFHVEYHEEYFCSTIGEIHKELLSEAVNDSREKAEMIAACAGKKLLGIKTIETEPRMLCRGNAECADACFAKNMTVDSFASTLGEPEIQDEESAVIVWEMES